MVVHPTERREYERKRKRKMSQTKDRERETNRLWSCLCEMKTSGRGFLRGRPRFRFPTELGDEESSEGVGCVGCEGYGVVGVDGPECPS
jgi:hypothetical protein